MELIDYLFTSYIYIDNYNSLFPVLFSIPYIMTTTFSGPSRLANFREKKASLHDDPLSTTNSDLKLTLPDNSNKDEKPAYQPSSTFNNTRTSLRLLKGRIERNQSNEKPDFKSANINSDFQPKLMLSEPQTDLKLVINDSPQIVEKKAVQEQPVKPSLKRIMIAKETPKEEPKEVEKPEPKKEEPPKEVISQPVYSNPHDEKPIIKEEEIEDSKEQPENENDLVLCPEGCGRKFNRKALEKHAKACKIVFMSKRKQFNSEAKRLTSKQQANIVKQNKLKEKKDFGKTKGKGFQKTGDNWKAASEDFRNAIKGVKKDEKEQGDGEEEALKTVNCEFCEKLFAEVLIEKHLENCLKRKEKEKKNTAGTNKRK